MNKAYELSALIARLKGRGLDIAEEAAKVLVEESLLWVEDSVKLSENKYDDMAVVIIPIIRDAALKAVDKIDGQVG